MSLGTTLWVLAFFNAFIAAVIGMNRAGIRTSWHARWRPGQGWRTIPQKKLTPEQWTAGQWALHAGISAAVIWFCLLPTSDFRVFLTPLIFVAVSAGTHKLARFLISRSKRGDTMSQADTLENAPVGKG